ncbi:MAG: hypothetical protein QW794_04465 [Thermosphaera sp.]
MSVVRKLYLIIGLLVISLLVLAYFLFLNTGMGYSARFEILSSDGALSCKNLYVKIVLRNRLGKPISIERVSVEGKEVVIQKIGSGMNGNTYVRVDYEKDFFEDAFVSIIELNTTRQQGEEIFLEFHMSEGIKHKTSVKIARYSCMEDLNIEVSEITHIGVWKIEFRIKNKMNRPTTIDQVLINGKTLDKAGASISLSYPMTFSSGEEKVVIITLITGYSSGDLIEIRFHTILGNEYPIMLTLP